VCIFHGLSLITIKSSDEHCCFTVKGLYTILTDDHWHDSPLLTIIAAGSSRKLACVISFEFKGTRQLTDSQKFLQQKIAVLEKLGSFVIIKASDN
jgi:hypothetical protein